MTTDTTGQSSWRKDILSDDECEERKRENNQSEQEGDLSE
jgi:hypothetical protein